MGLTGRLWRDLQAANDLFIEALSTFADHEGHFFRVDIFGSARRKENDPGYETARNLARDLATDGIDIVTGGGPGIMEGANRGALEAQTNETKNGSQKNGRSIGVPLRLPFEQSGNSYMSSEFSTEDFPFRLQVFGSLSLMHICIDGGVGTALESLWFLQHSQIQNQMGYAGVKRQLYPLHPSVRTRYLPKILLVGEGFNWVDDMLGEMDLRGTAPSSELDFILKAKDHTQAAEIVKEERVRWRNHLTSCGISPRN